MAFTMPNYPMLTNEQVNPFHGALQGALRNYQNTVKSAYLPRQIQAEIFNKQFAPLAQIASSPLAMAMLPTQQSQMAQMLSRLLQQSGGGGGSMFGGGGGGGGSMFGNAGAQGQEGSMPAAGGGNAPQGTQGGGAGNPLLPQAGGGLRGGVIAKTTAPYSEQVHPPGSIYSANGDVIEAPTGGQVERSQETFNAYNNLKDLIPDLLEQSREFENKSLDLNRAGAARFLQSHHLGALGSLISSDPELSGRWNNFTQDINRAGIVAQKLFPASQSQESYNQHMAMLAFDPNKDTYSTYSQRLKKLLKDSQTAYKNAQIQGGSEGGQSLKNPPKEARFNEGSLPERTKRIGNHEYHKVKGKWLPVLGGQHA